MLENELAISEDLSPYAKENIKSFIETLSLEESRYANEKKIIQQEATRLEKQRDENRAKDLYFEYAEVLLQIAIVMASVSVIIAESLPVLIFSLLLASVGTVICANGYLNIFTPLLQLASR